MSRRDRISALIEARSVREDRGYKDPVTGEPSLCRIWTGPTSGAEYKGKKKGRGHSYGRMSLDGATVAVHKTAWVNENGLIPPKKQLDHLCKQRDCSDDTHMELVTHLENQKRRAASVVKPVEPVTVQVIRNHRKIGVLRFNQIMLAAGSVAAIEDMARLGTFENWLVKTIGIWDWVAKSLAHEVKRRLMPLPNGEYNLKEEDWVDADAYVLWDKRREDHGEKGPTGVRGARWGSGVQLDLSGSVSHDAQVHEGVYAAGVMVPADRYATAPKPWQSHPPGSPEAIAHARQSFLDYCDAVPAPDGCDPNNPSDRTYKGPFVAQLPGGDTLFLPEVTITPAPERIEE